MFYVGVIKGEEITSLSSPFFALHDALRSIEETMYVGGDYPAVIESGLSNLSATNIVCTMGKPEFQGYTDTSTQVGNKVVDALRKTYGNKNEELAILRKTLSAIVTSLVTGKKIELADVLEFSSYEKKVNDTKVSIKAILVQEQARESAVLTVYEGPIDYYYSNDKGGVHKYRAYFVSDNVVMTRRDEAPIDEKDYRRVHDK